MVKVSEVIEILKKDEGFRDFLDVMFGGGEIVYYPWDDILALKLADGQVVWVNLSEIRGNTAKEQASSFVSICMRELDM